MSYKQCPRCLKHIGLSVSDSSVHTCTPTKEWRELEQERDALLKAVVQAREELTETGTCADTLDKVITKVQGGV